MRPALSIVLFTTLAGAGYGLWLVLGIALALDLARSDARWLALGLGFVLTTAGLCASVAHLGQPLRAWRALSQWRSSWLSREGVASLACALLTIALGAALYANAAPQLVRALGVALAATSLVTIYCTAQIYASLRTIPAWHNGYVCPAYATIGLAHGLAMALALRLAPNDFALAGSVVLVLIAGLAIKLAYWRFVDRAGLPSTRERATGLEGTGRVVPFENPHTEANYLTREFGFAFARRHARRLRMGVVVLLFVLPIGLALVGLFRELATSSWIVVMSLLTGTFVERWLFFAEARHVVMLYYGAPRAA